MSARWFVYILFCSYIFVNLIFGIIGYPVATNRMFRIIRCVAVGGHFSVIVDLFYHILRLPVHAQEHPSQIFPDQSHEQHDDS